MGSPAPVMATTVCAEPRQVIFLLAGWSCSGKDTVGEFLVKGHGFHRAAFADPLKDFVAKFLEIDRGLCDTQEGKQKLIQGHTLRSLLIHYGEARRRQTGVGCWAKALMEAPNSVVRTKERVVITDWRHLEELIELQKALPNARLVPICIRRPSQLVSPVADKTEYSLLGFPFSHVILNDGAIRDLKGKIKSITSEYVLSSAGLPQPNGS